MGRSTGSSDLCPLTLREREVLESLALLDLKPVEVARHLFISPRTVDAHKYRIIRKLGVRTIAAAVAAGCSRRCIECGFNTPPDGEAA